MSPHYLIVEDRRDPARPELHVVVESADPVTERLTVALRERLGITCVVRVLAPGSVPRTEVGKAKRLIRWDTGEPPIAGLSWR